MTYSDLIDLSWSVALDWFASWRTDFLDKQCPCAECTAFAQNEAEQVGTPVRAVCPMIYPAPCMAQPDRTEMKTIGLGECPSCRTFDCWLHYLRWEVRGGMKLNAAHHHLVTFPRTALGQTDALGHDRDEGERARANAHDFGPLLTDTGLLAPAPANSQTCSLCGTLHGRWVKTHTAQGETRPCVGSWK